MTAISSGHMSAGTPPAPLSLRGVGKAFGDLWALDDVTLELEPGQVHALLGANGSGKSTLVKLLSGVHRADRGEVLMDGESSSGFPSPSDASRWGVRVVHQEAPLLDTASVTEAVALFRGYGARALGPIGWRRLRARVQELLDRMDVPLSATTPCSQVAPADRAGLALAIVVGDLFEDRGEAPASPVRMLIVDEVTASIHESESERHLRRLRAVADKGTAVVMVTHRLGELEIADDLSILRGGRLVYREAGQARLDTRELVAEMVGAAAQTDRPTSGAQPSGPPDTAAGLSQLWRQSRRAQPDGNEVRVGSADMPAALAVTDLVGGELRGCSFEAVAGEIVGFAGLRGSGVTDLPRLLSGDLVWTSGQVSVDGRRLPGDGRPRDIIRAGLTALPADRLRAGGVGNLEVRENVTLPALGRYWRQGGLRERVVQSVMDTFDVRPREPRRIFASLSGGNQQKVLLGKWLLLSPSVLVLADPTYGVDPGARETIFNAVRDAALRGVCVLFFSTEPEQLVRLCTRVLVLRDGELVQQLRGAEVTLENVVEWSEK